LTAYEQSIQGIISVIQASISQAQADPALTAANGRQQEIGREVGRLRGELESFLRERGVSAENLADVGKATERIAQLDQDIEALTVKVASLEATMSTFTS